MRIAASGQAPPRNDRGDEPGRKQRSFRGRKPVGIRPFPLLPHVEKVKSEEVIVKRWKALPVGEGGPTGRVRDRYSFLFILYSLFFSRRSAVERIENKE